MDVQMVDLKHYIDAIEGARARGLVVIKAVRSGDMVHLETGTPEERAARREEHLKKRVEEQARSGGL